MNKEDLERANILSQRIDRISGQIKSLEEHEPQDILVLPNRMTPDIDKSIVDTVVAVITANLESKLKKMKEEFEKL